MEFSGCPQIWIVSQIIPFYTGFHLEFWNYPLCQSRLLQFISIDNGQFNLSAGIAIDSVTAKDMNLTVGDRVLLSSFNDNRYTDGSIEYIKLPCRWKPHTNLVYFLINDLQGFTQFISGNTYPYYWTNSIFIMGNFSIINTWANLFTTISNNGNIQPYIQGGSLPYDVYDSGYYYYVILIDHNYLAQLDQTASL